MFNWLMSSILISPAALIILLLFILLRKKRDGNRWEKDILENSFNSKEKTIENNKYSNKDQSVETANLAQDIKIFFENKRIETKRNIIFKNNRYYLSIDDFKSAADLKIEVVKEKVNVFIGNRKVEINYKRNSFKTNKENFFKVPSLLFNKAYYISLIDLTEILDLKITWNYNSNEIKLFNNRDSLVKKPREMMHRPALIRLEDVTAGSDYYTSEGLQKLRIVTDLMSTRELPFHIAWISRYMKPKEGIDNDLTKIFNIKNADFIFTLDYMINRGGIVGLHGYTHQYGDSESGEGYEFGVQGNPSADWAKDRAAAAIAAARLLNIPYSFFESPHYSSTIVQQKVFEKYFDYIFEPAQGVWNDRPYISKVNKRTIYVPAPLGYVEENNIEDMLKRIKNNPENTLGALFYHPYKEFEDIELEEPGYPYYKYSNTSMLNKILDCLEEEGYSPVRITDIKMKN